MGGPFGIELGGVLFELDSIHKHTVEGMVERVIDMITHSVVFGSFANYSCGQLAGLGG